VDCCLPYFRQQLITCLQCAHCTLPPPPLRAPCLLLSFALFLWDGGHSVQRAMLVYPRGSCGNTECHVFAHLLVCISQAGALLFSQCNVVWRSFVQAGGSECQNFASSSWFFSAKCGSSISANFLIYRAHYLLPPSSHHLGSLLHYSF
jgi:hypothetical protein